MSLTHRPLIILIVLFFSLHLAGQTTSIIPGGVPGTEAWYIAEKEDLNTGIFQNFSQRDIQFIPFGIYDQKLLNFNPTISIKENEFYLKYNTELESTPNRNFMIVSVPGDTQNSYPLFGNAFNENVPTDLLDSLSRNTFVIETQQGFASSMKTNFSQHQNAHVYNYSWSHYNIEKKFKSYGLEGETSIFIARNMQNPELDPSGLFTGYIPEFIVFDRYLTKNELNRVESYLSLKYGITKWNTDHYRDSGNKIYWNKGNNELFGNRIFGIGRDHISGLNQLQCESVHATGFLVAATHEILETNAMVQDSVEITDKNFLVFGDNGLTGLKEPNSQGLHQMNRVWLAQVTGDSIKDVPIHLRLELNTVFPDQFLEGIAGGIYKVWMLRDPYVNNGSISEFDNGNIEYATHSNLEILPNGKIYAHFNEIYFDSDTNNFDQFTFGVGPEMLVQVRYSQWQCVGQCFDIEILITGGTPPYTVTLTDEMDNPVTVTFDQVLTDLNEAYTYTANVCVGEYTVEVVDDNNASTEYSFSVEALNYTLDLGPDQFFSEILTEIELNAGAGINDPDAIYQWFFNGEEIAHDESILIATEAGNYSVIVTTSDMACQLEDDINLGYQLNGTVTYHFICSEALSYLSIEVSDGIPPYQTHIYGIDNPLDVTLTHGPTETYYGIAAGTYLVTVSDSAGSFFEVNIVIDGTQSPVLSLGPDATLSSSQPSITLDATIPFGTNPNHIYEWFHNGLPTGESTPQITVDVPGEYSVIAIDPEDQCEVEANIMIDYLLEVTIIPSSECEENSNFIEINIDFGYQNYITEVFGDLGYYFTSEHSGNYTVYELPVDEYLVRVTDNYGNGQVFEETVVFTELELDIYSQLIDICEDCTGQPCEMNETNCGNDIPLIDFGCTVSSTFTLDASLLIQTGQNVDYEWFIWDDLIATQSELTFAVSSDCHFIYENNNACNSNYVYTVIITDTVTGCSVSQQFATKRWCPILSENLSPKTYNSLVYPNPGDTSVTFYYEVSSNVAFGGTVEVFNVTGQILYSNTIDGNTQFVLPYTISTSGTYFIRTTTTDGTVLVDRVIIK
ncbi:MAG: hypothetical protein CVU03_02415 [Bacteroidetes bacterium HGW-Bacteroidetes-2]|jgi:hypothetical protein|nr:MAG: hypothetical protein CVU13_05900 [Bacteroidetes bacterium HGW-Bacteroidetes-8]PKP26748.1 MAG: hypothetical protein CVU03_02415 [Bacteroidetes bacterium HGW-Bacteroidetes-2]